MSEVAPLSERKFGLLQATALNMSNMIGVGPFITIPLLMSAMGGPQAMLGWLCAVLITLPDSLVWSELGAAMPGSGGSYVYLRNGFGRETWGRLMAFLFIWQFIISGPMEIASGYIGFANYLNYIWPDLIPIHLKFIAAGFGVLNLALLCRHVGSISKLTVALWIGTLTTAAVVIFSGLPNFDPKIAFDFPPGAFDFSVGFFWGLGQATLIGIYDYLGYYDVCFIGDEVRNPGRVIPRSVILSLIGVAIIYFSINLSVIGVIPWREFVPAESHPQSMYVVSIFMERLYGTRVASLFTIMILWTACASVFALLLGYSRIPYAAARDGYFFKPFGNLHPKGFPHISIFTIGGLAILCCFLNLGDIIAALVTIRILIQFIGQIVALSLLRRVAPDMPRPYRMWLYPLPSLIASAGWMFVFLTTQRRIMIMGISALILGLVVYFVWSAYTQRWPFNRHISAK